MRNTNKVKKFQTSEYVVWETETGRISIENVLLGRIIRSNVRSLANAEEYIGEMEGTLVACDQIGYLNNGRGLRSSKQSELKCREIGEIEDGWTFLGGSVEGSLEKHYSIWRSPKGRFSIEKTCTGKPLISGLKENELKIILEKLRETPGGNIAYQLTFPGF